VADAIEHRLRDLGEFIRDRRHDAHLSVRKMSELAGISNPYLSQIERGLRKPSAQILQQIANALRISAESLYVRAGFLDERDDDVPDLEREINRDPSLSDKQKETLLEVYRSFRAEK
jgi:transcriptional regulator with XRE-family HTH domain